MKAVIVEIKGNNMIVMNKKGIFQELRYDSNSNIGDEIIINDSKQNTFYYIRKISTVAAMFIFAVAATFGAITFYSPYAYVDIDINPSVELVINRYMKVLEVNCLNEDAIKIVTNVSDFKYRNMNNVVEILLEKAKDGEILSKKNENAVMFTVSGVDNDSLDNISINLKNITIKKLSDTIEEENILTENISLQKHDEAIKMKISPGRIILLKKLKEIKPDANIQEVEKLPVRETLKIIRQKDKKELEKQEKQEKKQEKNEDKEEKNKFKDIKNEQKEKNKLQKEQKINKVNTINKSSNNDSVLNNVLNNVKQGVDSYKQKEQKKNKNVANQHELN